MAIEIRELVVKTSVVKTIRRDGEDYVSRQELRRMRKDLEDEIMDRVRSMIDDIRERR